MVCCISSKIPFKGLYYIHPSSSLCGEILLTPTLSSHLVLQNDFFDTYFYHIFDEMSTFEKEWTEENPEDNKEDS